MIVQSLSKSPALSCLIEEIEAIPKLQLQGFSVSKAVIDYVLRGHSRVAWSVLKLYKLKIIKRTIRM